MTTSETPTWTDEDQARLLALVQEAFDRGLNHVAMPTDFARHALACIRADLDLEDEEE